MVISAKLLAFCANTVSGERGFNGIFATRGWDLGTGMIEGLIVLCATEGEVCFLFSFAFYARALPLPLLILPADVAAHIPQNILSVKFTP